MRGPLRVVACVVGLACGASASAETVVPGGAVGGQTWTAAGSPYRVLGDVTVAEGETLTIEPGVTVIVAASDGQASGANPDAVEITIAGRLVAQGTAAAPIRFTSASTWSGRWQGLVFTATAAGSTLEHVVIVRPWTALLISAAGTNTFSRIRVEGAASLAAWIDAGNPTIEGLTAVDGASVITVRSTSATIRNCVLRSNGLAGIQFRPDSAAPRHLAVDHCTIVSTLAPYGIDVGGVAFDPGHAVTVSSSIITGFTYGVYGIGGTAVTVTTSNVWGNGLLDYFGPTAGAGSISADPLFVSSTDVRLRPSSPCVDAGTAAPGADANGVARPVDGDGDGTPLTDIGAYEFVPQACGNAALEDGEACDDGNVTAGDGCSAACAVETSGGGDPGSGGGAVAPADPPRPGGGCAAAGGSGLLAFLGMAAAALARRARCRAMRSLRG